jgi:ankyrin repeat protein
MRPLFKAASHGKLDLMRILVNELGADVNQAKEDNGATALILAAQNGVVDIVRCLGKELGADMNKGL